MIHLTKEIRGFLLLALAFMSGAALAEIGSDRALGPTYVLEKQLSVDSLSCLDHLRREYVGSRPIPGKPGQSQVIYNYSCGVGVPAIFSERHDILDLLRPHSNTSAGMCFSSAPTFIPRERSLLST